MRNFRALSVMVLLGIGLPQDSTCQVARPIQLKETPGLPSLVLKERLRISKAAADSGFFNISDVALSPRSRRTYVADAGRQAIFVFDSLGRPIARTGRDGDGPGEFRDLLKIAIDPHDSLFVWDLAGGRVSVFGPELRYVRGFRLPATWLVNSLRMLPDGRLLATAYSVGARGPIRIIGREGPIDVSFGPQQDASGIEPFAESLLGGEVDVTDGMIIYAQKSPYTIATYSPSLTLVGSCVGQRGWTTDPKAVVRSRGNGGAHLQWGDYRHIARLMGLGGSLYLVQVLDPSTRRAEYDLVRADCSGVRRTWSDAQVRLVARVGETLVGIQELEYPEVVIYTYQLGP